MADLRAARLLRLPAAPTSSVPRLGSRQIYQNLTVTEKPQETYLES